MREIMVELVDGGRLAGVLHLPSSTEKRCPVVIYCPGKNGERYEVHRLAVKFARRLTAQGVAFLRFDYYGLGLSDGHFHDMTTTSKVSNVIKAYEFVQTLPEIDADAVYYLGFSDGARIALMAANRTAVDKLVLWSPLFYEFGGNFPGKRPRFTRHPKYKEVLVMPWAGLWVGMDFYRDLKHIDIEQEITNYKGQSLLVYGDDDPLIEEEFEYLQTNRCRLYQNDNDHQVSVVPGAGHLFTSRQFEQKLMSVSEAWITL